MRRRRYAFVMLVQAMLPAGLAAAPPRVDVGAQAPEIRTGGWKNLPEGMSRIGLADLRGRIVVLDFWATWCGPCRAKMPDLVALQKEHGERGVVVLTLCKEPAGKVEPMMTQLKMDNLITGVNTGVTNRQYGIRSYPSMFVLDLEGKVVWRGNSTVTAREQVERLLKDSPPRVTCLLAESAGQATYAEAERLLEKKRYAQALKAFERIAREMKQHEIGRRARAKCDELKKDEAVLAAVAKERMDKDCRVWLTTARALARNGRKDEARQEYERVIKQYPESGHARTAREEMEKL